MKKDFNEILNKKYYAIWIIDENYFCDSGYFQGFYQVQGERYVSLSSRKSFVEKYIKVYKNKKTAEKYAEIIYVMSPRRHCEIIETNTEEFLKKLRN